MRCRFAPRHSPRPAGGGCGRGSGVRGRGPCGRSAGVRRVASSSGGASQGEFVRSGRFGTVLSLNYTEPVTFPLVGIYLVGDRLLVIWDGSPIHRRAEVKAFVAAAGGQIHLEAFPPYAPDRNPVEWLWRHLKEVELRNLACLDLEQLPMELHLALGRVRQRPRLIRSFFAGAGLEI